MKRIKIDYGIDLGTTNSAISRMENGKSTIKKTRHLKDTMPSCVFIDKKKVIRVGDDAYNALKRQKLQAMKNWDAGKDNAFIEFKRTMGTDKAYHSSNLEKELTSEELSAEVLKGLKSLIKDEEVKVVVITVPAAFKNNQKEATREAAKLAGFNQIELLQEPVAASMAYGLNSQEKEGFWLTFDFGGGTFDAALLKVEEGIMKVIDTEGDNYLGGKNLDAAIVDEIILPYLENQFVIDSILTDDAKKQMLRNAMKYYAEEAKIALSFDDSYNILSDLGDIPGEDDEGEEFELDINITQAEITKVLSPVFQRAIDVSKNLLKRNNLHGSSLSSLILVGGPTFSPVLRKMLEDQICKPDTRVDPMTVVSKGAALYASTIDISEQIREQTRDKTKIQLQIENESSTVEKELLVPIKILPDKMKGEIPAKVFVELERDDKAWSSGRVEINDIGEVIEIQLNERKMNVFEVLLFDEKGNALEGEPSSFSVIQGSKIANVTLTHNIGIEVKDIATGKPVFKTIKGLDKNQSLPATGIKNGLKTQKQIRSGMESDFILIPVYEGEHGAEGTRAVYNEHVKDIKITGADLPSLLPENSEVELTLKMDISEIMTLTVYFPYLEYSKEIDLGTKKRSIEESRHWLNKEIKKAKRSIAELKQDGNQNTKRQKIEDDFKRIEKTFENNKNDDGEVLTNLRKTLKAIDELNEANEWPKLEQRLKEEFDKLEKANEDLGDDKSTKAVNQFRSQLEEIIREKDIKLGKELLDDMDRLFFQLTLIYQLMSFIRQYNSRFDSYNWKDRSRARTLLNKGLQIIAEKPQVDELHSIVIELINLLPHNEKPVSDDTLLKG